jgi:hypothetical protein
MQPGDIVLYHDGDRYLAAIVTGTYQNDPSLIDLTAFPREGGKTGPVVQRSEVPRRHNGAPNELGHTWKPAQ